MNPLLVEWLVVAFALGSLMVTLTLAKPLDEYYRVRGEMLKKDKGSQLGSRLNLSAEEKVISDFMMKEKYKLIEESRVGRKEYFPAHSFYRSKPQMERTTLFKLIQMMPKGAALHLHDQAVASLDWLVKNATYRDNIYMCINKKTKLMEFTFNKGPPKTTSDCSWTSVKEERSAAKDKDLFDENIKKNLSMLTTDPLVTFPTVTETWDRFLQYFDQVFKIIFYAPVFRDYFHQALEEFHADNVQYIELRSLLDGLYDLNGTVYGKEKAFQIYREVTEEFKRSHTDFSGAKFIMSALRIKPPSDMLKDVKEAMAMRKQDPESMLGFDLVSQEDPNKSLRYYLNELLYPSEKDPSNPLPYYFHAAETNWQGTDTDYNLIDAILLNTSRIGHGYGLIKHPYLVKQVKQKDIAIEVNPISNQLLGLVKDPRNHGVGPLMTDDFPVVVSSDDPAVWEASPLSSDFYVVFMNICGEDCDLRFLKQLAMNSIKYSGMSTEEKSNAMALWRQKWQKFIKSAKGIIKMVTSESENLDHCLADSPSWQCP